MAYAVAPHIHFVIATEGLDAIQRQAATHAVAAELEEMDPDAALRTTWIYFTELCPTDDEPMHLVGSVGKAQRSLARVHIGERSPLRHAGRAVDLDRFVDDPADALRNHRLDRAHPDACLCVAEHVHRLGGLEDHHAHRFDVYARFRDRLDVFP